LQKKESCHAAEVDDETAYKDCNVFCFGFILNLGVDVVEYALRDKKDNESEKEVNPA